MKSIINKTGLLAAAFVVCLAGSAQAGPVEVKVPFPFVVRGKTLPAGQYRVENDGPLVLLRGEKGNTARMVVLANPSGRRDPAGDKPVLTFTRDDTQYRLTDIWESGSQGLEIVR